MDLRAVQPLRSRQVYFCTDIPACEDQDYLSNVEIQYKDKEGTGRRTVSEFEVFREDRVGCDVEKDGSFGFEVSGTRGLSVKVSGEAL